MFNAGLGTDIVNKKGATLFIINFAANNIGDVAYQSHLSRLKYAPQNLATGRYGVYNMGRNFSIRLKYSAECCFEKKVDQFWLNRERGCENGHAFLAVKFPQIFANEVPQICANTCVFGFFLFKKDKMISHRSVSRSDGLHKFS